MAQKNAGVFTTILWLPKARQATFALQGNLLSFMDEPPDVTIAGTLSRLGGPVLRCEGKGAGLATALRQVWARHGRAARVVVVDARAPFIQVGTLMKLAQALARVDLAGLWNNGAALALSGTVFGRLQRGKGRTVADLAGLYRWILAQSSEPLRTTRRRPTLA